MKRLLAILLIFTLIGLSYPSDSEAIGLFQGLFRKLFGTATPNPGTTGTSTTVAGGAWYYTCAGTDTYGTTAAVFTGAYDLVSTITGVSGKTITKIGFKTGTGTISATACKVALYSGTTRVMSGETISSLSENAWLDSGTLGGYAASGDVIASVNCDSELTIYRNNGYDGDWGSNSYASFPPPQETRTQMPQNVTL